MIIGYARVSTDGQSSTHSNPHSPLLEQRVFSQRKYRGGHRSPPACQGPWDSGAGRHSDRHQAGSAWPARPETYSTPSTQSAKPVQAFGRGDAWADTTTARQDQMTFELRKATQHRQHQSPMGRTSEGRTRAKARGVRFGRKLKLTPYQRQEALQRRALGEPLVEIARTFGVSHSTNSRLH